MRRRSSLLWGFLIGALGAVALAALSYLGRLIAGLPFVPFDIFDWMARHLPGGIIALAISSMVRLISSLKLGPTASTAKQIEQGIGLVQFIIGGGVVGLIVVAIGRARPRRAVLVGILAGALTFLAVYGIETSFGIPAPGPKVVFAWLAILFIAWGFLIGTWTKLQSAPPEAVETRLDPSRRQFLLWMSGSTLALLFAAVGLSRIKVAGPIPATGVGLPTQPATPPIGSTNGTAASPPQPTLAARFPAVPGTRPELTPAGKFYRIDINTDLRGTDMNTWRLNVDGLVNHELALTLPEIQQMPAVSQAITLECISNEVGGDLISTGVWTGTPLKNVLDRAGLKDGAGFIHMTSFDGFYETMPISEAMDDRTLLVYDMDGQPLAQEHGFPLRIYIPNHYGMKQPKWLERMTLANVDKPGFWVDRGWDKQAIPQTTAVIDTAIKPGGSDQLSVGGIAYAGARGISKVEVQMDNGQWAAAQLRNPPLSKLTWIQWRIDMPSQTGRHILRARAYDGAGALQRADDQPPEPSGATGINEYAVDL